VNHDVAHASMMSRSRAASSRGISHFPKDDIADVLPQAADWYNVDGLVKGALKQSLDGDKIEQVAFVCHFDQDIDVRLWRCVAARHRAEDSNAGNVTLRELRLELSKFSEDFREGDHLRKGTAASGWKEAEVAGRVELDLQRHGSNVREPAHSTITGLWPFIITRRESGFWGQPRNI
jgi:hypothetical protein